MEKFYDTCALLNLQEEAFESNFLMSNISLAELENIKTSASKDPETKYKARHLTNLLHHNINRYEVILYDKSWDEAIRLNPILADNDDSKIIITAWNRSRNGPLIFVTSDLCCEQIAKSIGLTTEYWQPHNSNYTGFIEMICNSDEELSNAYNNIYNFSSTEWSLLSNEYLILKNTNNDIIDKFKYTKDGFAEVQYNCFESKMFGKVKPKDTYQMLFMDSLKTNKITMVHGAAGTGKSYIALGYLFSQLEKQNIDKIIIFCNTVATAGSAKLGFYPGTRTDKLLDSQIGNFLASKLGDKIEVEQLISENKLVLLPMSDIRGYDTTGMKAGIYITEAQNLDTSLMKLALQRIGEDSICILDGDTDAQVDSPLYAGTNNGMRRVSEVFRGDPAYGEIKLQKIYRSHIAELAESL